MITAYRHQVTANAGKQSALIAVFPAFREALGGMQSLTRRELLGGIPLSGWREMAGDVLPFSHRLSARQLKSVQNMTAAAVSGWQESLSDRVRELITGSSLPELRKTVLYRINSRKAWWSKELSLPWLLDETTGELVHCTEKQAAKHDDAIWLPVDSDDLALARALARQGQKRHRYPDLRRVNTLTLDSIIAKVTPTATATAGGQVNWWLNIATLTKGKPVKVPLAINTYFERQHTAALAAGGSRCGAIQLHLVRDAHGHPDTVAVSLLLNSPDAELRTEGSWVGVDFGMSSALLATSDGQLLGAAMLRRLHELDKTLNAYAADLQKRGVKLKTDPRYQALQRRITDYVTNEVGRLLNRLADRKGEAAVLGLVLEKLDFRGGGLSRRLNRLVTRTGRKVLKARLAALTKKHGIAVTEIPSPWTSCECSGCGYTHKNNRRGREFRCRFCGLTLHADVNASRVIRSRRSRATPEHTGPRSRKNTFQLLDSRHRQRWNLPARETVPGVAGALERPA